MKGVDVENKKGNQLFIKICNEWGLNPIPEYQFAKEQNRKFRTDYFFQGKNGVKLALEVEGGVYGVGGHNSVKGFKKDIEKYNLYTINGIFLYRVQPENLFKTKLLEDLKKILNGN